MLIGTAVTTSSMPSGKTCSVQHEGALSFQPEPLDLRCRKEPAGPDGVDTDARHPGRVLVENGVEAVRSVEPHVAELTESSNQERFGWRTTSWCRLPARWCGHWLGGTRRRLSGAWHCLHIRFEDQSENGWVAQRSRKSNFDPDSLSLDHFENRSSRNDSERDAWRVGAPDRRLVAGDAHGIGKDAWKPLTKGGMRSRPQCARRGEASASSVVAPTPAR